MANKEITEYKQRLEARMRQILKENPDCNWIKTVLHVDDADAEEEADTNELDEFLASLS